MSLVLSPKTGRLVKVGGKAFNDLLEDPKYRDSLFLPTSPRMSRIENNMLPTLPPMSALPQTLPQTLPQQSLSSLAPSQLPVISPRLSSPSSSLSEIHMPVLPVLPSLPNNVSYPRLPNLLSGKLDTNEFDALSKKEFNALSKKEFDALSKKEFNPIPTLEETLATTRQ